VVAFGSPDDVAKVEASHTGRYLADILSAKRVAAE
jgi:excinuclease ABC subunit A